MWTQFCSEKIRTVQRHSILTRMKSMCHSDFVEPRVCTQFRFNPELADSIGPMMDFGLTNNCFISSAT